ncbi:hypothetical protein L0Y47_11720 [Ectopseudomonas composti]|uniref:hypothetical protein n=1 Tax=Ectopseudomonas composti TaxID=658457 RepID=UPI0009446532|nr:hypothetical protein [Pseudomonas composti]MDN5514801.1 hypothetical protein [Pseudomonas sp.]
MRFVPLSLAAIDLYTARVLPAHDHGLELQQAEPFSGKRPPLEQFVTFPDFLFSGVQWRT